MQVTRVSAGYYQKSFGAKFSEKVEQSIQTGRERYRYNFDAMDYYNKKVEEARKLSPEFTVTSKNVDGNMINPYGRDIILLQKSRTFVRKPIVKLPLRMDNLELTDLETLDGITTLCECLKMAPYKIYRKDMGDYFETNTAKKRAKKLLEGLDKATEQE